jgi:ABC-type molybdate transport system substrate-binding protein
VSLIRIIHGLASKILLRTVAPVLSTLVVAISSASHAANTNVAVAANFTEPAKEIAQLFESKTGHKAVLSFGATGQFYTQITQAAPFQVFLSADESTPKKLVADGLAVASSLFTYAIGKLVLFSTNAALVAGEQTLRGAKFNKIAIADPVTAPYGTAAVQVMKALGVLLRRLSSWKLTMPNLASWLYHKSLQKTVALDGGCRQICIVQSGRTQCYFGAELTVRRPRHFLLS